MVVIRSWWNFTEHIIFKVKLLIKRNFNVSLSAVNPVFVSALICAFLFYGKIFPLKNPSPFFCSIKKSEITRVFGTISSNPVKTGFFSGTYRLALETCCAESDYASCSSQGKITLFVPSEIVEASYPGKIYTKISGGENILIENGLGVEAEVRLTSGEKNEFLVAKIKKTGWKGKGVQKKFYEARALCRLQFKRLMYSWGNAGGLLLALISGSREYTESDVASAFRNAGLSHILALSGMHLSLFGGMALFFGKKLSTRKIADGLQLLSVLFFVWFAGISPSLFRALLSALLIFICSVFKIRKPDSLSLISLTFLLHSVIFPEHIFDSGFMLSYSSLSGIILLSKLMKKLLPVVVPFKLRASLADSSAAQLATAPVSLKLFGKLMPVGIIASIFVAPMVVLFLYLGLAGIVLCLALPFLSGPINVIMNELYKLIKFLVMGFSNGFF